MATRARLAVLALLLAGTVIAARAGRPDHSAGSEAATSGGQAGTALVSLMVVALGFLGVLVLAAVRYRRVENERAPRRGGISGGRGVAALIALAGFLCIGLFLAATERHLSRRSRPGEQAGDDPPVNGEAPTDAPADAPAGTSAPEPDGVPEAGSGSLSGLFDVMTIFVTFAVLTLLALAWLTRTRGACRIATEDAADRPPSRQTPGSSLAEAAQRALSAVDQPTSDPRAAIIRSYGAFERALTEAPDSTPHPADTASDVLHRAADAGRVAPEHGWRLVELFTEARFSTHPMTDSDRIEAADTLRELLDDLRGHAWT